MAAGDFTGFAVTMIVVIQACCEMVVPFVAVFLMRPDTPGSIFDVVFVGCVVYIFIYLAVMTPKKRLSARAKMGPGTWCNPMCLEL